MVCLDDIEEFPAGVIPDKQIERNTYIHGHELGHIFGFLIELFEYYRDSRYANPWGAKEALVQCADGSSEIVRIPNNLKPNKLEFNDVIYYEVITHAVVQTAKNHFNCQDKVTGIRIASLVGICLGTSHWDEVCIRFEFAAVRKMLIFYKTRLYVM